MIPDGQKREKTKEKPNKQKEIITGRRKFNHKNK
jgi:hypothetical protein